VASLACSCTSLPVLIIVSKPCLPSLNLPYSSERHRAWDVPSFTVDTTSRGERRSSPIAAMVYPGQRRGLHSERQQYATAVGCSWIWGSDARGWLDRPDYDPCPPDLVISSSSACEPSLALVADCLPRAVLLPPAIHREFGTISRLESRSGKAKGYLWVSWYHTTSPDSTPGYPSHEITISRPHLSTRITRLLIRGDNGGELQRTDNVALFPGKQSGIHFLRAGRSFSQWEGFGLSP
jgi:hypothetical protein